MTTYACKCGRESHDHARCFDCRESDANLFQARVDGKATLGGIAKVLGVSEQEAEARFNQWEESQ